ncbi:helix-turn-helix domain-containing protein [Nocardia stercoris]|uniref:helix-turn-helix domain-containing protein n=1 Tax=Nocardia stercoris TaxID=2483361 RepID=UPI00131A3177|nr:helix-turn-helix domain-containing protein [Nocardia stercoris]
MVDLLRIPADPAHGDCADCPNEDHRPSVSIALQRNTTANRATPEHPLGVCTLIDPDRPADTTTGSVALVLRLPLERIDPHLRTPAVDAADLIDSPLHDVMASHMWQLAADAEKLSTDAGADAIGDACVELAAALLASAAGRANPNPAAPDSLLDRIRQFVRTEATDPDLSPATIATAHNLSVRSLYRLCAEAGISLRQWIIEERVAHAAALLTDRADLTVTAIAHASGFRDATHFTRRFRARYGATPAAWRHRHHTLATHPSSPRSPIVPHLATTSIYAAAQVV